MHKPQAPLKRILTDAAGYCLILGGILFGWVPGPGGIPLILAGLGLLSINNAWAARLRTYLLERGGKLVELLFPPHPWVQLLYDVLVIVLLALVSVLLYRHAAVWQVSVAVALFLLSALIALMNRDRYTRLKRKLK